MKILENLWQVGGAEYTTVEDAAIYLVRFDEKAILIDAGCGNAQEKWDSTRTFCARATLVSIGEKKKSTNSLSLFYDDPL